MDKKIAILLTCFNRRDTTLKCLKSLSSFKINYNVYLVDDGSTDGTKEAINKIFPKVKIIDGNGNLFWNRGMLLAWTHAEKNNYDYYLWLNDDVILYKNAFKEILECSRLNQNRAIISGIIESHDKKSIIYGGFDESKKIIQTEGKMNKIMFMNGNFVLIPKFVYQVLGKFDEKYHHDLGDVDYGLRAKKSGIKVLTTRFAIGSGDSNSICRVRLNNSSLKKRFGYLYSPLGSNPNINFYFRKKHYGIFNAFKYFIFQIFLNLIPDQLNSLLFKKKYI